MHRFQFRGFVSLLLSFAFLVTLVSGLVLWLAPAPQEPGGGLLLGIGKGTWKHVHIYLSLLMLAAGVVHFWLNWPAYWSYLWQRTARRLAQKRELAGALAVTLAVVAVSSLGGHGDMQRVLSLSPQQIAEKASQPVDRIVSLLEKEGIAVHDPSESLMEIARQNHVSPMAIVAVVQREAPEMLGHGPRGPH